MDEGKIVKEGIKLLEEFSCELERIPDTAETHYVLDLKNITRKDDSSVLKEGFSQAFKKIVPRMEEDYVVTEKGV